MQNLINVVELIRVSTESQAGDGKTNMESQHEMNLRTCASYGLRIVERVEIVMSGSDVASSPQMQYVIRLCESRRVRGVVLNDFSRLFRPDDWRDYAILQAFKEAEAILYRANGPVDLTTEAGTLTSGFEAMMAGFEKTRIRTRTRNAKITKRALGQHVGGATPLGVAYNKRTKEWSYTDEIGLVREMFRRFLSGQHCIADIARDLFTTRRQVDACLRNPTYSGWLVRATECDTINLLPSSRLEVGKRNYRRIPLDEPERVRLPLKPIISEEDFAQVQRIRDDVRRVRSNKRRTGLLNYLGFAYCPTCGLPLYSRTGSGEKRERYYSCRSRDKAHRAEGAEPCPNPYQSGPRLDNVIDRVLPEVLLDRTRLLRAIAVYNARVDAEWRSWQPLLVDYSERERVLRAREQRVKDNYEDGDISREQKREKLEAIRKDLDALQHAVSTPMREGPALLDEDMVAELLRAMNHWEYMHRDEKRTALEAMQPIIYADGYCILGIAIPLRRDDERHSRSRLLVAPPENPQSNNAFLYFDLAA